MAYTYQISPDVANYLQWWVSQNQFQEAVRVAVNNELFWKNMFEGNQFRQELNKIPSTVQNAIQNEMPRLRSDVERIATDKVKNNIPMEIIKQLPTIIAQNSEFVQLFAKHRHQLESALNAEVTKIIGAIVNDPKYHEVNQIYFDGFKQLGDKALDSHAKRHEQQMGRIASEWATQQVTIHTRVEAEVNSITQLKTEHNTLTARICTLENENRDLNSTNNWMKIGLGASIIGLGWVAYTVSKIRPLF